MAERLRKRHQDEIRTKIQASQLINVLQDHALGLSPDLPPSRIKAIELLLKKSVPDLSSTEITGDADQPIAIKVVTGIDA
jgi:hypothetical protein